MIKLLVTVYLLASISLSSLGQTADNTTRLKSFIKIWGFLKYHHPLIATGNIDWDSVFVNNAQKIMDSKNPNQFNSVLLNLINSVAKPSKVELRKLPDSLFELNKTDIDWIIKSNTLGDEVKHQLQFIYENKAMDTNKYIKIIYGTADFSGEKKYADIGFPDMSYRLLFLSRFWNIINYFAPYKYLATKWDDVLEKFIPKLIASTDTLSYYTTLQELSKKLNDGHSQLIMNEQTLTDLFFGSYTPPFYCEILDGQVFIRNVGNDSIAKSLHIRQGDIVSKINGKELTKIIAHRKKYISSSNKADEIHQLSRSILDGQTSKATLEIKRENKIFQTTINRVSTQNRDWGAFINYTHNDVGYKKYNDSVLLIYAMQIWDGNIDTIKQLIKQSRYVIFDVRNYPQNDAFFLITDPFLSEPKTLDYTTIALPQFPGLFKWKLNANKIGLTSDSAFKGKVIILCDERTQSQGEYACMVLQTIPGSVTIGSQTAGADGVVTYIPMGGGLKISYSGYGVYYPDKRQTQQVGIKIDIPVKKTREAITNNKDEILERAFQYVKNAK